VRTSWQVTRSVWYAMFMREASARIMADRFGWFWMFAEPIAFVVIMIGVRELLGRIRIITGAEYIPWLITGLMAFTVFRDGVNRSIGAIDANKGLFAYRQVSPVDPVLVRNALEGVLKSAVFVLLIVGAALIGHQVLPADPIGAMFAWVSLWLLGVGGGLVASAGAGLVQEIGRLVRMAMLPMFMLSGAIIPVQVMPHDVQAILLYNPVMHGIEILRVGFFPLYHAVQGVELLYLWYWALSLVALGLGLHVRFASRLKAQ